jgi:hypothetical protein
MVCDYERIPPVSFAEAAPLFPFRTQKNNPVAGTKPGDDRERISVMARVNETTVRFWGKVLGYFVKYYPARIKAKSESVNEARQLVYAFKDGERYEEVAQMTASHLKELFPDGTSEIVFTCVPASTPEKNELRYKRFMERVCELTGAINGYPHITVSGSRLAVHEHRHDREKSVEQVQVIDFDADFFRGKSVVCFDDILTTGQGWAQFGEQLEKLGATILGGLFLGKTTYKQV